MEWLRKLILQTRDHLRGLTLSQRLAIGSCVGLIALSLFWLVNWAGTSEYVPLFDQALTAEELTPIRQHLDSSGVKYKVSGDRLLVPADEVLPLQAQLAQSNVLPHDISITFDKLIENTSPWFSREEQDWRRNIALSNELSLRLRQFVGVKDARVFIDKNLKRTIGPSPITPTASIQATMAPGVELDKSKAHAMVSFVSRAVSGLDLHNVQVTTTSGWVYSVPKTEDGMAFDDLEDRQKKESYFTNQIRELLDNIPGVRVAVRAELDPKVTQLTEKKHGKPAVTKDRSKTSESTEGGQPAEPGVVPNTGSPAVVAQGDSRMEESETETTYDAEQDVTLLTSQTQRHGLLSLSASVFVPRSFLAAIYAQANSGKEPSDAELEAATSTKSTLDKVKTAVETLLPGTDPNASQISVAWFHDNASLALASGGPVQAGTADTMLSYVQAYGGKAGLGTLALLSLVMMLMMVRRVGEGPVLPGEAPPEPLPRGRRNRKRRAGEDDMESMAIDDAPIGEAEVSEHLLIGHEVDEETLRAQKVIEQVTELIKSDPEVSVSVLQRWIDLDDK